MYKNKMTQLERRAIINISSIMGLRMIGLFMVLPIFTLYATTLRGSTPFLVGIAMGVYGLTQALFQIPFGSLSDKLGRKPIIFIGLLIFIVGSLVAGTSQSITWMIIGRALQGAGAIGSTMLAMMADLTTEEQRTKAMAIAGISIGFSFSLAMFAGPVLTKWVPINYLFYIAAALGGLGILLLLTTTPSPTKTTWHRDAEPELKAIWKLLRDSELMKLNIGILSLHAIFTASFVVIPLSLLKHAQLATNQQWYIYLPTLLAGFIISLLLIGRAEQKQQVKPYFLSGIVALLLSEALFWSATHHISVIIIGLCLFFGSFSLLEAFMPSLVSRTAPATRKGSALGIYSCSQFLGIFLGGMLGGWLYGSFGFAGVYLFCILLAVVWLTAALLMQPPRYLVTQMWRIHSSRWDSLAEKLRAIPGLVEVTFIAEDGIAYLKMERATANNPELLRMKDEYISIN